MVTFGVGDTIVTSISPVLPASAMARMAETAAQNPAKPEPAITIFCVIGLLLQR
jgi:hypothetical protein